MYSLYPISIITYFDISLSHKILTKVSNTSKNECISTRFPAQFPKNETKHGAQSGADSLRTINHERVCVSQYWYDGDEAGDLPVDFSIVWDGDFFIDKPSAMKGSSYRSVVFPFQFFAK